MFAMRRGGVAVKRAMGWSSGRAAGAGKKPRLVDTAYRLMRFASTSPEQLFQRKIECEEYGAALALARRYPGLDPDLVYQSQWRKSQMSRAAVEDFLVRISKHSWVLHECLERTPDGLDSMRHLLELGLRATDVDAFVTAADVNADDAAGRLVLTDTRMMLGDADWTPTQDVQEVAERLRGVEEAYRRRRLAEVESGAGRVTLRQQDLLRQRQRLLVYLAQLDAYEEVLGGRHCAPQRYTGRGFAEFRAMDPLAAAVKFARDGNYPGVEILLSHFQAYLGRHWLLLLANIPETEAPGEYEYIIPRTGRRLDEPEVLPWEPTVDRRPDWSHIGPWGVDDYVADAVKATAEKVYAEFPQYSTFCTEQLCHSTLADWFSLRANEIERLSAQVSCAVELVRIGLERGLDSLNELHQRLSLLATLAYECGVADGLTLSKLSEQTSVEVVRRMMSKTGADSFVRHLTRWVLPFLDSAERQDPGVKWATLRQFLVERAEKGALGEVRAFFEALGSLGLAREVKEMQEATRVAVDCCYAWGGASGDGVDLTAMTGHAQAVHNSLLKLYEQRTAVQAAPQQVRDLARHLEGATILAKYGRPRALAFFRSKEAEDPETVAGMLRDVLALRLHRQGAVTSSRDLKPLVNDLRELLIKALPCLHPSMLLRYLVEALLHTGTPGNLKVASQMMDLDNRRRLARPGRDSETEHVLSFDDSAACVARVATQLFDVALGAHHEAMSAARRCLALVEAPHSGVVRVRRLVEAAELLESLGAGLLPAEVRAHSNPAALLASLLRRRRQLYREQVSELTRAAVALRIGADSPEAEEADDAPARSECRLLALLADAALAENDAPFAADACRRLVGHRFAPGWRQCERAARLLPSGDAERARLLHFALAHCPDAELQRLVALVAAEAEEAPGAGDAPPEPAWAHPPFYDPAAPRAALLASLGARPTTADLRLLRLRRAELAAAAAAPPDRHWELAPADAELAAVAVPRLGRDPALFLAAGAQMESAPALDHLLGACLGADESRLRLAVRTAALSLWLHPPPSGDVTVTPPPELIEWRRPLESDGTALAPAWASAEGAAVVEKYRSALTDLSQARRLQQLAPGIDLARFGTDAEYREASILGLCLSAAPEQFEFALALGARYSLASEELRTTHAEFLLTEADLAPAETEARLRRLGLALVAAAAERLYERLPGPDLARLELLLRLVAEESGGDAEVGGRRAEEHLHLLRKLRPAAPGADYKALTGGGLEPAPLLAEVERQLGAGNVHVFAKLAPQLRASDGSALEASSVFAAWAARQFWQEPRPADGVAWVHRYEQCASAFSRLRPRDLATFVAGVVFAPDSRQLGAEARREVVRRAARFCRQAAAGGGGGGGGGGAGRRKKRGGGDEAEADAWRDASAQLDAWAAHLDMLADTLAPRLAAAGLPGAGEGLAQFELLPPGPEFFEELLAQLLLWRWAPADVAALAGELGDAARDQLGPGLRRAVQQAAVEGRQTLADLIAACAEVPGLGRPRATLLRALEAPLAEPELRARLGPFLVAQLRRYGDAEDSAGAAAAAVAAQALLVLQEHFEAAVGWSQEQLLDADQRSALLGPLVEGCEEEEEMRGLHEALAILRHLSAPLEAKLWRRWVARAGRDFPTRLGAFLVDALEQRAAAAAAAAAAEERLEEERAVEAEVADAVAAFEEAAPADAFALAAVSRREQMLAGVAPRLLARPGVCERLRRDERLLRRLVDRHWLHVVVPSPLYDACARLALERPAAEVRAISQALRDSGCHLEAAALLAECDGLEPGLRTLGGLAALWRVCRGDG